VVCCLSGWNRRVCHLKVVSRYISDSWHCVKLVTYRPNTVLRAYTIPCSKLLLLRINSLHVTKPATNKTALFLIHYQFCCIHVIPVEFYNMQRWIWVNGNVLQMLRWTIMFLWYICNACTAWPWITVGDEGNGWARGLDKPWQYLLAVRYWSIEPLFIRKNIVFAIGHLLTVNNVEVHELYAKVHFRVLKYKIVDLLQALLLRYVRLSEFYYTFHTE